MCSKKSGLLFANEAQCPISSKLPGRDHIAFLLSEYRLEAYSQ